MEGLMRRHGQTGKDRPMTNKGFASVSEMMADISADESFNAGFEERLQSRQIVKSLAAMRTAKGVSQEDIARELKCSQSKISKLESGTDAELQLRDLEAYGRVLGQQFQILVSKRAMPLAERVKYHAFGVRDAFMKLVRLAHKDDQIVQGVAKLHVEAFVNIMKFLQQTSSQLPPCPDSGEPYVRIATCESEPQADGDGDEPPSARHIVTQCQAPIPVIAAG
jgi:transcriptional regulator with XRE-family HTH domain